MADVALILSLFAATPFAYFMQRHLVFRPDAPAGMREFLRFASVAVGTYAINIFSLPILVLALNHTHSGHYEISGMRFSNALVAQLFISAGVACISWFSHSRFSFKGPQPSH